MKTRSNLKDSHSGNSCIEESRGKDLNERPVILPFLTFSLVTFPSDLLHHASFYLSQITPNHNPGWKTLLVPHCPMPSAVNIISKPSPFSQLFPIYSPLPPTTLPPPITTTCFPNPHHWQLLPYHTPTITSHLTISTFVNLPSNSFPASSPSPKSQEPTWCLHTHIYTHVMSLYHHHKYMPPPVRVSPSLSPSPHEHNTSINLHLQRPLLSPPHTLAYNT